MVRIHRPGSYGMEGPLVGYIKGSGVHLPGSYGMEGPFVGYGVGGYNNINLGAALLLLL